MCVLQLQGAYVLAIDLAKAIDLVEIKGLVLELDHAILVIT